MQRCPSSTESPSDCLRPDCLRPNARATRPHLHRFALVCATFALMAVTSACGLFLPGIGGEGCTEEGCAVECDEYVLDENGCNTCECVEPEVTVCWDDSECGSGQRCDSENYCETPPGCTGDEPCPAVCYGRCVEETTGCFSDADCDDGERCRFPNTGGTPPGEPTEPVDGDEAAPAPPECPEDDPDCNDRVAREGICVDAGCDENAIDLPACPPGTRPVYDDGNCGNIRCVEIDDCRDLGIDVCESVPGCEVISLPGECNCSGGDPDGDDRAPGAAEPCVCDDGEQLVCARTNNGCYGLSPEECSQRPDCEGYWTGAYPEPEPCECAPGEDCACDDQADPIPPVEEFYCTDRRPTEGCRDSRDCGVNERCEVVVICTDDCYEAEDGSTGCISECWEEGQCVETERSCYDLREDECLEDPDCQLVDYGCDCAPDDPNCACPETPIAIQVVCEPRPRPSCNSDADCGEGERCEYEEFCPPCFDGSDPGCFAPCWAEGRCVEGGPEPERCTDSDQCGEGFVCETITVCEDFCGEGARPAPPPDEEEDPIPPPPCENCYEEGRCVPENRPSECYFDEECGDGFFCDYYDDCIGPPDCVDCLVACAGQCRPTSVEPGYCLEDSDCAETERCAVEQDICFIDPNGNSNECFHECVPRENNDDICLEDSDCGEGRRCATELDVCVCSPDDPNCSVCYSQCVDDDIDGGCPQVITGGREPGTEECRAFPTPCDVPEGYEECDLNGNAP